MDTHELVLCAFVHAADLPDRLGAKLVLDACKDRFPRLSLIWADGGYTGSLVDWVQAEHGCTLEIVKRCDDGRGFKVLPRRWVVERPFAWLGRYRRLAKDYEWLPETSEAMILIAMTHLMLRRLQT